MAKSPFDYVTSINDGVRIELDNKYSQFLINRHYSYFIDTIMYANQAGSFKEGRELFHYNYYLGSLPKKKRFTKWFKSEKNELIELIAKYYDTSYVKASEIYDVLEDDEKKYFVEWNDSKGE